MWSNVNQEYSSIDMWHGQSEEDKQKKKKTKKFPTSGKTSQFFALLFAVVAIVSFVGYVAHPGSGNNKDHAVIKSNAAIYGFENNQCKYVRNSCKAPLAHANSVAMIAGADNMYVSFRLQVGSLEEQDWRADKWASILHIGNVGVERLPSVHAYNGAGEGEAPDPHFTFSIRGGGGERWNSFRDVMLSNTEYEIEVVTVDRQVECFVDGESVGTLEYYGQEDLELNPLNVYAADPFKPALNAVLTDLVVCSANMEDLVEAPSVVTAGNSQQAQVCGPGERLQKGNLVFMAPIGVTFEINFDLTVYSSPSEGTWANIIHVGSSGLERGPAVYLKGGEDNIMTFSFRNEELDRVKLSYEFGVEMQFRVVIDRYTCYIYMDGELRGYLEVEYSNRIYGSEQGPVPIYASNPWSQAADATVRNILVAGDPNPPTDAPTSAPTLSPTKNPTTSPTKNPTTSPTKSPSKSPTKSPTTSPTKNPTKSPTKSPTTSPTKHPTTSPTKNPTTSPTKNPTTSPTKNPTTSPTKNPTTSPTQNPTTSPTKNPTTSPTKNPTKNPSTSPTTSPTKHPTPEFETVPLTPSPVFNTDPSPPPGIVQRIDGDIGLSQGKVLFPIQVGDNLDFSMRVKVDSSNGGRHILRMGDSYTEQFPLFYMNSACTKIYLHFETPSNVKDDVQTIVDPVTYGRWYHVQVKVRALSARVYIDGELKFSWNIKSQARLYGSYSARATYQDPPIDGAVKDLEVYLWDTYDNKLNGVLDVNKQPSGLCGLYSWHDNYRQDRQFAFGSCSALDGTDDWGPINNLPFTEWDEEWSRSCPDNQFMVGVYSEHDNGKQDREFSFKCAEFGFTLQDDYIQGNCEWDTDWVNSYNGIVNKRCAQDKLLVGVHSRHDDSTEDRVFRFECCSIERDRRPKPDVDMTTPQYPEMPYVDGTYMNEYDGEMDVTLSGALCELRSEHDNGKQDRLFALGRCEPTALAGVANEWGPVNVLPETDWDDAWTVRCPTYQFLVGFRSWHSDSREDRKFEFKCSEFAGSMYTDYVQANCEWDANWYNDYNAKFVKTCPKDKVMAGVSSMHHNSYEDRLFKFLCCNIEPEAPSMFEMDMGQAVYPDYPDASCPYDNDYDQEFDVWRNGALCEVRSVHSNSHQDRRFAFGACNPELGNLGWSFPRDLDETLWEDEWTRECPDNEFLVGLWSKHDNGKEDRVFRFKCASFAPTLPSYRFAQGNCEWDMDWYNDFNNEFVKTCPGNKVLAGIKSEHDDSTQDRRFRFKCCNLERELTPDLDLFGPMFPSSGWDNEFEGELDVTSQHALCGVRSEHNNLAQDRRFSFASCPALLGGAWGPMQPLPATLYEQTWTRECPHNQFLKGVYSVHNDGKQDRVFTFKCAELMDFTGMRPYVQANCEWDYNWFNDYNGVIFKSCPQNKVLAGVMSQHHDGSQDRVFRFKCCSMQQDFFLGLSLGSPQYPTMPYVEGTYDNEYDGALDVTRGGPLCEIRSVHDNSKQDRRFALGWCLPDLIGSGETSNGPISTLSATQYKAEWTRTCAPNQFIVGLHSFHDNGHEDRVFEFRCANFGGNLELNVKQANCEWDPDWFNEYNGQFVKACPRGKVVAGVQSRYYSGNKDRVFKFMCCAMVDANWV